MKRFVIGLVLSAFSLFGLSTKALADNILLINGTTGTSEPGTTSAITSNFVNQATSLGHTVLVSDGIPGSFAGFNQVWDFRFSENFVLTPAQRAQYLAYIAAGGGMFVMGENAGFPTRNASILALINELGGGSLGFTTPNSTQTVRPPFTGPDPITNNQITYAVPGGVTSPGTGDYITDANNGTGTGIAWEVGELGAAPLGALAVIFDVNWAQNQFDIPDSTNLLRNILGFVQGEVNPPIPGVPVPEPASMTLLGLGLVGIALYSKRRKRA